MFAWFSIYILCMCIDFRKGKCLFLTFMSFHAYELKFMFASTFFLFPLSTSVVLKSTKVLGNCARQFLFVLKLFVSLPLYPTYVHFISYFSLCPTSSHCCLWKLIKLFMQEHSKANESWMEIIKKSFIWEHF